MRNLVTYLKLIIPHSKRNEIILYVISRIIMYFSAGKEWKMTIFLNQKESWLRKLCYYYSNFSNFSCGQCVRIVVDSGATRYIYTNRNAFTFYIIVGKEKDMCILVILGLQVFLVKEIFFSNLHLKGSWLLVIFFMYIIWE